MKVNKCKNIKTETYTTSFDDFMLDIVEDEECYHAYIYRKGYTFKLSVFGWMKSQSSKEEYIEMVLDDFVRHTAIYMECCDLLNG